MVKTLKAKVRKISIFYRRYEKYISDNQYIKKNDGVLIARHQIL